MTIENWVAKLPCGGWAGEGQRRFSRCIRRLQEASDKAGCTCVYGDANYNLNRRVEDLRGRAYAARDKSDYRAA